MLAIAIMCIAGWAMECGSHDLVCQVLALFEESEVLASGLTDLIGRLGQNASGIAGGLAQFLRDYGQTVVGLLGFSFGFWRWWRYREVILHKRLEQYIADSDQRLETAQEDLLEAIQRPGPGLRFAAPLFADADLTCVLRERRWDRTPLAITVARSADSQLATAIDRITRRIEATAKANTSLQKQLAAAHTLRGAIAAAVQKTPSQAEFALSCFRNALRIPHQRISIFAKELEAHQLRRLGHLDRAAEAYEKLQDLTGNLDARQQAIINARAKRYLAEIAQAQKIMTFLDGASPGPGSFDARDLMTSMWSPERSPGALVLRDNFAPFQGWDLLESAEMSYFTSFVYALQGANQKAASHLEEAIDANEGVLRHLKDHGMNYRRSRKKLKARAERGLERARAADGGDYDAAWLLPSLTVEQAQQISARIRAARGKQTVSEAA